MYFTCPGGSCGVGCLTNLTPRVGPLPKNLRPAASEVSSEPKIRSFRSCRVGPLPKNVRPEASEAS